LFTSVGAFPPVPDLGLDAVDILPGGEVAFSLGYDITSNTLGPLQHGDLLSIRGCILRRNQDLLAPFGLQPPAPDVGLDAVHVGDTGEILFSIPTNVFSERLNVTLHRGDLLSTSGTVVRGSGNRCARWCRIRPPVAIPLDDMMIAGPRTALMAFDCAAVRAMWRFLGASGRAGCGPRRRSRGAASPCPCLPRRGTAVSTRRRKMRDATRRRDAIRGATVLSFTQR